MPELILEAIEAAEKGENLTLLNLIKDEDISPDARDADGYSLITLAAKNGNVDTVELLAECHANINDNNNVTQYTPLHCAVSSNHFDVVEKLHELGANINIVDHMNFTPISYAIINKNNEIAKFLIEEFPDIELNVEDDNGYTLMHMAAICNMPDIIELLFENGLSINRQEKTEGYTPLHFAAANNSVDAVKKLIDLGADLDIKNISLRKPIHLAITMHANESVKLLSNTQNIVPEDFQNDIDLTAVFNDRDLNKFIEAKNHVSITSAGGSVLQFAYMAIPILGQFLKDKQIKPEQLNDLFSGIKYILKNPQLDSLACCIKLQEDDYILLTGGFVEHDSPVVIRKNHKDQWELTLIDRGAFAKSYSEIENKTYPIKTMIIPEDSVKEVIDTILQAKGSEQKEAIQLIFKQIPALTGNPFKLNKNIIQKPFKNDQCFFENYKSLVLYELVHTFGLDKGRILYKEFDIYLHQKVLEKYQNHYRDKQEPYYKEIIKLCEEKIKLKQQQLSVNTYQSDIWLKEQKSPSKLEQVAKKPGSKIG